MDASVEVAARDGRARDGYDARRAATRELLTDTIYVFAGAVRALARETHLLYAIVSIVNFSDFS